MNLIISLIFFTESHFRNSACGKTQRSSGFLLSLVSRIWQKHFCGPFREGTERRLVIEDVTAEAFSKILSLACCAAGGAKIVDLAEAMELLSLADRYELAEVYDAMQHASLSHLTVENCAELLGVSSKFASCGGTGALVAAGRELALREFEAVAATVGFQQLDEADVAALLEDDELEASGEDAVLAALARWIAAPGPMPAAIGRDDSALGMAQHWRGERLLGRIRWPLVRSIEDGGGGGLEAAAALLPGCAPMEAFLREARGGGGDGGGGDASESRLGLAHFAPRRVVTRPPSPPPPPETAGGLPASTRSVPPHRGPPVPGSGWAGPQIAGPSAVTLAGREPPRTPPGPLTRISSIPRGCDRLWAGGGGGGGGGVSRRGRAAAAAIAADAAAAAVASQPRACGFGRNAVPLRRCGPRCREPARCGA